MGAEEILEPAVEMFSIRILIRHHQYRGAMGIFIFRIIMQILITISIGAHTTLEVPKHI